MSERTYTAAEVAAAVEAEREDIAKGIAEYIDWYLSQTVNPSMAYVQGARAETAKHIATAIRARTGTDALAEVRAQARREALEEAAASQDCICPERAKLLAAWGRSHNGSARWAACGQPNCAAIAAAEIRALIEEPRNAG